MVRGVGGAAVSADDDPRIHFPATCPECGKTVVMNYHPDYLTGALKDGKPIEMWASCHDKRWDASAQEVQQIRKVLEQWSRARGS